MNSNGAMMCAKHPKVETLLRCASCGTPICLKCAVQTAVGMKCRACGTYKGSEMFSITPVQALVVAGIGLVGGMLGGLLATIGFWAIFLGIPYGQFIGHIILRASGRKMGVLMNVLTGGSLIIGGLGIQLLVVWLRYFRIAEAGPSMHAVMAKLATQPDFWLTVAFHPTALLVILVITVCAISRLRFSWGPFRW